MILFPDTHFFLHFKHPRDLPWGDLQLNGPIVLAVCRTAQKEIEKHKYELRGRPQDRAREYATKLAEIVNSSQPTMLREKNPAVLLDYITVRPVGWQPPADLDLSWGDDAFVADVLAFSHQKPSEAIAIMTGDPGLLARARSFNVATFSLAGRGWELPPEATKTEKEIEKLRKENADLRRMGPIIEAEFSRDGKVIQGLDLKVVRHQSLSLQTVSDLVEEIQRKYPRRTDFSVQAAIFEDLDDWRMPIPSEIEQYSGRYEQWLKDARQFIEETPQKLDETTFEADILLNIRNDGSAPAEAVRLVIDVLGGFRLSDIEESDEEAEEANERAQAPLEVKPTKLRMPPLPPEPTKIQRPRVVVPGALGSVARQIADTQRWTNPLGAASGMFSQFDRLKRLEDSLNPLGRAMATISFPEDSFRKNHDYLQSIVAASRPRDPHAFYWLDTPTRKKVSCLTLECGEFLHRMNSQTFNLKLFGAYKDVLPRGGAIRVRLFSRNLRQPFEQVFPIRFTIDEIDAAAAVTALLP